MPRVYLPLKLLVTPQGPMDRLRQADIEVDGIGGKAISNLQRTLDILSYCYGIQASNQPV